MMFLWTWSSHSVCSGAMWNGKTHLRALLLPACISALPSLGSGREHGGRPSAYCSPAQTTRCPQPLLTGHAFPPLTGSLGAFLWAHFRGSDHPCYIVEPSTMHSNQGEAAAALNPAGDPPRRGSWHSAPVHSNWFLRFAVLASRCSIRQVKKNIVKPPWDLFSLLSKQTGFTEKGACNFFTSECSLCFGSVWFITELGLGINIKTIYHKLSVVKPTSGLDNVFLRLNFHVILYTS